MYNFWSVILSKKIFCFHFFVVILTIFSFLLSFFFWKISKKILDTLLSLCYYHVTYAFQCESALYSCLNVKKLFARIKNNIWSLSGRNESRTHNNLVRKRTFNPFSQTGQILWKKSYLFILQKGFFVTISSIFSLLLWEYSFIFSFIVDLFTEVTSIVILKNKRMFYVMFFICYLADLYNRSSKYT